MRTPLPLVLTVLLSLPFCTLPAVAQAPLGARLAGLYSSGTGGRPAPVLVYFKDKGPRGAKRFHAAEELLSAKSIARRVKARGAAGVLTDEDVPVEAAYVGAVSRSVTRVRHVLKWFNAVSVEATPEQVERLRRLPFVREIELVGRWTGAPEPELPEKAAPDVVAGTQAHLLNYGASFTQNDQIGVTNVHDLGIRGEGVTIGVFDNGFRLLTHESFASMEIVAQYDFVDHKVSVVPYAPSHGGHGVNTLSTIGGYKPGQLIGPAFRAKYVLARTENDSSETAVEEDNWAAAIQWADSIGVDVTSTSLGYLDYDGGGGWTWVNMDGNTTVITQAADHAVSLGIVVVNSAGNYGAGNGTDNTLGAPADGDSVIAAGAVSSTGVRASFSSVGPTTDVPARVKPDVMAMGVGVRVASSSNPVQYGSSNGTSFSCPLAAGVAALILSANPSLGPMEVRDAMRNTASNAASPNNLYGWGILDADSAIRSVGIVPMAKLSGLVFHDLDGDGLQDPGEPGMAGEQVVVSGASSDTAASGAGGGFLFDSLFPGPAALTVAAAGGWIVTTPAESLAAQVLHRDSVGGFAVGIFEAGTAAGEVWFDADGNGTRDTLETPLDGRVVVLNGPVTDSAFTNLAGQFSFVGLPPGAYTASLVPQGGWLQTFPPAYGSHSFTVTSGFEGTGIDFGETSSEGQVYPVRAAWNLLSLPTTVPNADPDSLYPNAISGLSLYAGGYYTTDTIPNGKGYWVKFPGPQNILIEGNERTLDTVEVAAGWNLIGTLSGPTLIGAIEQSPAGIVVSPYYGFSGSAYVNAAADSFLQPHAGYWVKCSAPGLLILESDYLWVGQNFTGGCQCDTGCGYVPPNTVQDLGNAGVEVLSFVVRDLPNCAACSCPAYTANHYALIRRTDQAAAEGLGYLPMNPPPF